VAAPVIAALDPYVTDWLDLLARWLHVIAAIVWIGTSFYFVALDNHLRPPRSRGAAADGVGGEAWEIHGGGFYRVEKYRVTPPAIPDPLYWFKWEAYTTWLSGFALFVVLYYAHADTYLVDPTVADLSQSEAIAISIGLLAAAWLVYDILCRLLGRHELLLATAIASGVIGAAYGVGKLFSERALPIQLGAMLGTIMVANVLFVIIPAHRQLIRAKEAGREPEAGLGLRGKQRSVHNNYLTLPVVIAMLGPHFPFIAGQADGWAVLVGLMAIGAWIRLFFNLHHAGRNVWAIPVTAAAGIAILAVVIRPGGGATDRGGPAVPFAQARAIVQQRCVPCHSEHPTNPSFGTAPAGVTFDTPEEIASQAQLIDQQAVQSQAMPLGNATGITEAERRLLGRWIAQGAKLSTGETGFPREPPS
jgi:uncharacterized membrane protein